MSRAIELIHNARTAPQITTIATLEPFVVKEVPAYLVANATVEEGHEAQREEVDGDTENGNVGNHRPLWK